MQLTATYADGKTRLRALLDHPMESGHRRDSLGSVIDANFLKELVVKIGDRILLESVIGPNLSKNPYLSVEFDGVEVGDAIEVVWTSNNNEESSRKVTVEKAV